MGFKSVYRILTDLFPQVDSRLLKAVAIEHPKNVDLAVEVVISEVLPYLSQKSPVDSPPQQCLVYSPPSQQSVVDSPLSQPSVVDSPLSLPSVVDSPLSQPSAVDSPLSQPSVVDSPLSQPSVVDSPLPQPSAVDSPLPQPSAVDSPLHKDSGSSSTSSGSVDQEKAPSSTLLLSSGMAVDSNQLQVDNIRTKAHRIRAWKARPNIQLLHAYGVSTTRPTRPQGVPNRESEELILLVRSPNQEDSSKSGSSQTPKVIPSELPCEAIPSPERTETDVPAIFGKCQDIDTAVEQDCTSQFILTSLEPRRGDSDGSLTSNYTEVKEFDGSSSDELDDFLGGRSPQTELCSDGMNSQNSVVEETPNDVEGDLEEGFSSSSKLSQEIKIDILEDFIEAAKHHKNTLFSEVESIMNKMREVELQEKFAEQAQEEAARAGLETLGKVEKLKQMLAHAKEANDMHAGEVYGEKSILATEVKELQARLFSLSDERDKALAILDEMKQTLEARLAAANELKKTAEKQKLEKEESARSALAEQEAIMDKVVQESKILQQEAEDNSKLREFLVDHGHVVDTLQGEIYVICHDVRLLKEKFDDRVPLSKSISSNQTSCILASSGSSGKSMSPDPILEHRETFMSPNKLRSSASSVDGGSPASSLKGKSSKSEEKDDGINFDEEGLEFFD